MAATGKVHGNEAGHVILTLQFEREGKNWVGTCVDLGTSTFDRSLTRAQKKLHELVVLHLNALEEEGEREKFFEEHDVEIHWVHERARSVVVNLPLDRIEDSGPLFQPHVFSFPAPAGELTVASV